MITASNARDILRRMIALQILSNAEAQALVAALPVAADCARLAQELLKDERITKFQAEAIRRGNPEELVYGEGDRFICQELLGKGGMGSVYKAKQTSVDRIVALKTITAVHAQSDDVKQRFRREMKAAGRLEHPHIIRVYGGGIRGDEPFLAMEYIEGSTLHSEVMRNGRKPWAQACEWIAQAADGLAYAHEMKVVHRDIKPANLMLTKRGTIKVLDLGLARFLDESDNLTDTKATMGTDDYIAPEQIQGAKAADERADIYSLGCTLYFLCAGKAIFAHRSGSLAKMYAHGFETPSKLRDACPDAPRELETIFQKMVGKKPDDRYASMAEVLGQLRGLASRPAKPAPPRPVVKVEVEEAPPTKAPVVFEGSKTGEERSDNGLEMKLVWCSPGAFQMGRERVPVRLTRGFWMGKYGVTQGEWKQVMGDNPSWFRTGGGGEDKLKDGDSEASVKLPWFNRILRGKPKVDTSRFPVECVSWNQAMEFCRKLTEQERKAGRLPAEWRYTLPTEAQWEYACRAGTTTKYAFGDTLTTEQANIEKKLGRTSEVGSYPANSWGLCDMHGNVWERCLDKWETKLPGGDDPMTGTADGSDASSIRVNRGGSLNNSAAYCESSFRLRLSPASRSDNLGFRLVSVR